MENLSTLTVTNTERGLIAHALMVHARLCDAVDKHGDAKEALTLWERVVPETVA